MNALSSGVLSGMPPVLEFDKYPVSLIRPLALADVRSIIKHAQDFGFIASTCTCTYQNNSDRKLARKRLESLTEGQYDLKLKLFSALANVNERYLPTKSLL